MSGANSMPRFVMVRQLAMSGDVDQIIIDEAPSEQDMWKKHGQPGLVDIIVNVNEITLPYHVYKKP